MGKQTTVTLTMCLTAALCTSCDRGKQPHVVKADGYEFGVKIEVILTNGGTATLVCPKFPKAPLGAHGRECYLDRYDE